MPEDVGMAAAAPAPTPAPAPEPAPAPATEPSAPASEPATAPAADTSMPQGAESTETNIIASADSGDGKRFVVEKDPVTGKRTVKKIEAQPAVEPVEAAPQPEPEPESSPTAELVGRVATELGAEVEPYDLNEFSAALANGNVDERRVPQEFQKQYTEFRINQAVEAFKEKQAAEARQKAQVEKQLTPEEQAKAMRDFYTKLNADAKERALKDFNITQEEYDNLQFGDDADTQRQADINAAIEWHRQQLIGDIQQRANTEMRARESQQAIYKDIVSFVNEARAKEPHFNAIDVLMQERYKTLPYAEGRKVEEAIIALRNGNITEQQAVAMREYYEATRKEYYAKRNNLTAAPKPAARPPAVERPGEGRELPKQPVIDYAALRNGSVREKRQWIGEFMRNRNR